MSPFTEKEIEYLHGQRLGRLATVDSGGSPHIVPVGFRLDAEAQTIASTRGPPAGSRSAAAPNSTQKAVSSASAVAAGTRPGSPSCRSESSAGESKGRHSRKPGAAPAPSQPHNPPPRQAGQRPMRPDCSSPKAAAHTSIRRGRCAVLLAEALDRAVVTPVPERSLWEARQGRDGGRRPRWKWIGDARE